VALKERHITTTASADSDDIGLAAQQFRGHPIHLPFETHSSRSSLSSLYRFCPSETASTYGSSCCTRRSSSSQSLGMHDNLNLIAPTLATENWTKKIATQANAWLHIVWTSPLDSSDSVSEYANHLRSPWEKAFTLTAVGRAAGVLNAACRRSAFPSRESICWFSATSTLHT
jgi:hypothetical protein